MRIIKVNKFKSQSGFSMGNRGIVIFTGLEYNDSIFIKKNDIKLEMKASIDTIREEEPWTND